MEYDGSVNIDTRMNTEGVNKGTAEISKQLTGVQKAMQGMGKSLKTAGKIAAIGLTATLVAAGLAVGLLVKGIFAIGKALLNAGKSALNYLKQTDEVKQTFERLKTATTDAFRPLVLAALPWINQVANALIHVLEMIAQVTAYITGQSGYWRTVATSVASAGEAAKGSLASFDKLNVLQEQQPTGGGTGGVAQEWVEIGEEMPDFLTGGWAAFVEGLKTLFMEGDWEGLKTWFQDYVWKPLIEESETGWGTFIEGIYEAFVEGDFSELSKWFNEYVWQPIVKFAENIWEDVKRGIEAGWGVLSEWFKTTWEGFVNWFKTGVIDPIVEGFNNFWTKVKEIFTNLQEDIKRDFGTIVEWFQTSIIDPIVEGFNKFWTKIKEIFTNLWEDIQSAWNNATNWFQTSIIDPIQTSFDSFKADVKAIFVNLWAEVQLAWDNATNWFQTSIIDPIKTDFDNFKADVKKIFEDLWEDVKNVWGTVGDWFKSNVVNPVIRFINSLIGAVETALNWMVNGLNSFSFEIPDWLGGGTFGFNLAPVYLGRVPELAAGAVIPPNARFLAVLGDQRTGTNVEAPLKTIEQAVENVLARRGLQNAQSDVLHNVIELDGQVLYEAMKRIDRRRGTSLLAGEGIR